ncbi:MAG TPA: LytTR family DNA-binding domain-containing protein [Mobilitalea sp.]|nr:LytTR family DNA-binding domain-containing protein [Mobilitalea sp.]
MICIAIVEDDEKYLQQLCGFVKRYAEENKEVVDIKTFSDGDNIVYEYKAVYDIIFLDIQMKIMDGMKAAQNIRKMDENVILIFITNMAQYAIQGYSVNAMDFVLKPASYFAFSEELAKAIRRLKERTRAYLTVKQEAGLLRLDVTHITYIESQGHKILVHTENDTYTMVDTMKNMEQQMAKHRFSRCNNCYLVNLRYVERVQQNIVTVAGEELQISRPRKKAFMDDITDFVGGEVI